MRADIGSMLHKFEERREMNTHSIPFLMKLITDRASTLFSAREDCPVTAAQGRVVMYLKKQAGRVVTQRELEKYLGVSHATVKGLLQRLEEKGYVRTAFDAQDGRVKNVYLTDASEKYKEKVRALLEELDARMMRGLSEAEQRELARMLEKIYDNIT